MTDTIEEELRRLDDYFSVKKNLEQLPGYTHSHPQAVKNLKDLVEQTIISLARYADEGRLGPSQDRLLEYVHDLKRRWVGSGPLDFPADSRFVIRLNSIFTEETARISEYRICFRRTSSVY